MTAGHFTNTPELYREIEDLKDLLASIEDNGELSPGETARVRAKLIEKEHDYAVMRPL